MKQRYLRGNRVRTWLLGRRCELGALLALTVVLAGPGNAAAQGWSTDPAFNNPICAQPLNQSEVQVTSDGEGGMIAVWQDYRSGSTAVLYAQRFDADGNPLWDSRGVYVATQNIWNQFTPRIIPDGAGAAIIAWIHADNSNGHDLYAQRLSGTGTRMWGDAGIVVCDAPQGRRSHQLVAVEDGGAVIVWQDQRASLDNINIYAQKLNANGVAQWTEDGAVVCDASGNQTAPQVVTDEQGAYFCWSDSRGAALNVFAQRFDLAGAPQWTANGIALRNSPGSALNPRMVTDSAGGVVIAWEDARFTTSYVYGQRLNSSGTSQWTENGVEFTTGTLGQQQLRLTADGNGGAIATYEEYGPSFDKNILAQRVNGSGEPMWGAAGVEVCTAPQEETMPEICSDGSGGAIVTWVGQSAPENANDIFAQAVSAAGTAKWQYNGIAVTTNPGPDNSHVIARDGSGGAFIGWIRSFKLPGGSTWISNAVAQKVTVNGQLGVDGPSAADNWDLYE